MKTVEIYIDTSIKGPWMRNGACLYILSFRSGSGQTADTGKILRKEKTTENQLALLGLEAALKRIKEPCHLILYLESNYVAASLRNRWFESWRYNGWLNARNVPVSDADIWQSIEGLLNAHEYEVELKQPHTYREWMHRELQIAETADCKGGKNG